MKTAKRALSALMVLAMLMSCMGAAPLETEDEQQPTVSAQVIEVSPSAGEPEEGEPAGELQTSEPAGEPQTSEPAGEPEEGEPAGELQTSEPAGEPQTSELAGEPQVSEPADEPQVSEPAGEPQVSEPADEGEAEPQVMVASLGSPIATIANDITIPDGDVTWGGALASSTELTYTGSQIAEVTATLTAGQGDYTQASGEITYEGTVNGQPYGQPDTAPTDAGEYTAIATWSKANGDTGTAKKSFTIMPVELTLSIANNSKTYNGKEQELDLSQATHTATVGGDTVSVTGIIKGTDAGEYTKDNATGYKVSVMCDGVDKPYNYDIKDAGLKLTIDKANVTIDVTSLSLSKPYTGKEYALTEAELGDLRKTVSLQGSDTLQSLTAVSAIGANTYDKDTAGWNAVIVNANKVNVTSKNYTVTYEGGITITKRSLNDADTLTFAKEEFPYTGAAQTESPIEVKFADGTVLPVSSYEVSWDPQQPVDADTTVTVTVKPVDGSSDLEGQKTGTYKIVARNIKEATVTKPADVVFSENNEQPVTVTFNSKTLVLGQDYTLSYSDMTKIGEVTVTITGQKNFMGTATTTYNITAKSLEDQEVTIDPIADVIYDGQPWTPGVTVKYGTLTLTKDTDFTVEYADNTNAGTAQVTVKSVEGGNYSGSATATFIINKRPLSEENITNWTDVADKFNNAAVDPTGFIYDGAAHQWVPEIKFENRDGDVVLEPGEGKDYTVSYTRDAAATTDFTNVGDENEITVALDFSDNFDPAPAMLSRSYTIDKKEVKVSAVGTKLFGAKDPTDIDPEDFTIVVNEAAEPTEKNELVVAFDGVVEGEEDLFLEQTDFTVEAARVKGEAKELPGKYNIEVTVEPVAENDTAQNYTVTVEDLTDTFEITKTPAFNVVLGDAESETDITSHTVGQVAYKIEANEGQTLIDDLQDYVDITLEVNADDVRDDAFVVPEPEPDPEPDPEAEPVIPNIKSVIEQDETTEDKAGTFTIPAVSYSDGKDHNWSSGLPAGTVLTAVVVSKNDTGAKADSSENEEKTTVVPVSGGFMITYKAGTDRYAYVAAGDVSNVILDGAATVTVLPEPEDTQNVGKDDWIVLTVGGNVYCYSASSYAELKGIAVPAEDGSLTLTLDQIKALAGATGEEGAWFGGNPQSKLAITAKLLDTVNHTPAETGELSAAFDTVGVNSNQEVGNREEAESIEMTITDSVSTAEASAAATGVYGGSTPVFVVVSGLTGTITWTNATEWKNTPDTLPHSGDSFTVQYKDLVGNPVTHTVNVVRSSAVTSNTIYVQPITDNTVPAKALTFYGDTNVWEAGVLTVGGRTYDLEALAGSATYDYTTKRWQYVVTLGDINFPVGVPTTVSMAYEDLDGGEASIVITYKDQAQTPVMGSEPVAGSQTLWGYVESSASVSVSVYHADGSITQVPQDSIAVDQFGYFYVRLSSPLAEGERVTISTRDFCDNQKFITVDVNKELAPNAAAEILGANIVGELENTTDIYHRFATPVDLGALAQADNKSMTLPILAYKGIEIGEITFTLDDQGKLNVSYTIKSASFIPVGAKARMATFTSKPTIDQLVLGDMPVVVSDLKASATGTIPAVDVSTYRAADGTYGGVIWLQAAFDIDMTEDNYISRGGRDARFYRWLTESLQTESVLGAVYKETSAYASNVHYYSLYQTFENISRMS